MPPINLTAPVVTQNLDLYRVQQRTNAALTPLVNSPWGSGVEVDGVAVNSVTGVQSVTLTHNLGRAPKGIVVLHSAEPIGTQPYNITALSQNTAKFQIAFTVAPPSGSTINVWVL